MALLPTYSELKAQHPTSAAQLSFLAKSRGTIRSILKGEDSRLLLIVGPCSIHDIHAAKEYATKLKTLSEQVSCHFFLAMRVYCEKPRTSSGWKGFLYDPFLDGSHQIEKGLEFTRKLLLDLADLEVPAATEFLDPMTAFYYDDLISWGSIGARTSSSQPHRQLASGLKMPIGFKNGVAGNLGAAILGACSASHPHAYVGLNERGQPAVIQTSGNPDAHVVLRGGDSGPNYDPISIANALERLQHLHLPERVVVDCSHQNSEKRYDRQPYVFQNVFEQAMTNSSIRGIMLESHLKEGNQPLTGKLTYGVSITDGCLDWPSTKQLILTHQESLSGALAKS